MWTTEQRSQMGNKLVITAKLYDKDIGIDVARMIIDDLQDLIFESCFEALTIFRKDSKNKSWPRAADIRALVTPSLDKRAVAIGLAYAIDKAVARHGWNWEQGFFSEGGTYWNDSTGNVFYSFKEAVISEIGEVGWHAVCSRGGWLRVRESANQMEEGQFISQMRDQIQSTMQLKEQGFELNKIEMPKRDQVQGELQKLNITKLLGGMNE